jgi:hypothetical protein
MDIDKLNFCEFLSSLTRGDYIITHRDFTTFFTGFINAPGPAWRINYARVHGMKDTTLQNAWSYSGLAN